jgi:hypothetical protein
VQPGQEGVEGGEAGGVGQDGRADDRGEHDFEARAVRGCQAGINVGVTADGTSRGVDGARVLLVGGIEVVGIGWVSECGGDMEGRSDVDGLVDRVVGVDSSRGEGEAAVVFCLGDLQVRRGWVARWLGHDVRRWKKNKKSLTRELVKL